MENILSKREYEVFTHINKKLSNKEIAQALFVSEKTVKFHATSIYAKTNKTRKEIQNLSLN